MRRTFFCKLRIYTTFGCIAFDYTYTQPKCPPNNSFSGAFTTITHTKCTHGVERIIIKIHFLMVVMSMIQNTTLYLQRLEKQSDNSYDHLRLYMVRVQIFYQYIILTRLLQWYKKLCKTLVSRRGVVLREG